MVLGSWHEIWEAFLYFKCNQGAAYDQAEINGKPWPGELQLPGRPHNICVGFANQEAQARPLQHGEWSHGYQPNPYYDGTFDIAEGL